MDGGGGALSEQHLERLARYCDEEVTSTRDHKPPWVKVSRTVI
jgi:hypothetical protein